MFQFMDRYQEIDGVDWDGQTDRGSGENQQTTMSTGGRGQSTVEDRTLDM